MQTPIEAQQELNDVIQLIIDGMIDFPMIDFLCYELPKTEELHWSLSLDSASPLNITVSHKMNKKPISNATEFDRVYDKTKKKAIMKTKSISYRKDFMKNLRMKNLCHNPMTDHNRRMLR